MGTIRSKAIGRLTPFGVSWDGLTLADLEAFLLADPDPPPSESLTWEAKGAAVHRDHVLVAASAFGNSDLGGYLVIGASQDAKSRTWSIEGWTPRNPDPELQLNQWLELLSPRPPRRVATGHGAPR
jgi:hypothetical protein